MTDQTKVQTRRSFIFCPGTRPEMFAKALACGADIVCVDLEDAIAPQDKAAARAATLALFREPAPDDGIERMVRINGLRSVDGLADLQAIIEGVGRPPALMVPKVKSAAEIQALDELLSDHEIGATLHVIIETNAGLEAAYQIAHASGRLRALFFGGVDMAADLRCANTWTALLYARSRVVHAAAAAGLDVVDVPYLDLNDRDGMIEEARAAEALGFSGKGAIHPKQIADLNEVFTPDAGAVDHARRIVAAFAAATGGLVVVDGKLIEKPVLRTMHRIIAAAERRAG